jgi:adenylate cyclase
VVGAQRPTVDELVARGIYDPDGDLAAERLALIEYLLDLGATLDELEAAYPDLAAVASTRALRGSGALLTEAELAVRAGVPVETSERVWRAAGFPDPGPDARIFTEEEVDALRIFALAAEWLGEDTVLQVVRVIGSSMARVADAAIAAFLVNIGGPALAGDPGGLALARANTEAVTLLRSASGVMDAIFLRHVEALQRPVNPGDQSTQELTVGFADLVGSTALAQRLSIRDLGIALEEFDELTADVVVGAGGRVVKLIGDEVMYVATDPRAGCEIGLELAERLTDHPRLPPVRGGLAHGSVLTRDGDYFGPVVNLASRAIKLAAPGSVVAAAGLAEVAVGYRFASIGVCELKGFDEPVELFEVRRS